MVIMSGCGEGGNGGVGGDANATSTIIVGEDTQFYDGNTTTEFDFNNSIVIVPNVIIPYEGGNFDITVIPSKDKNLILEENAIMITKTVNGFVVSSDWADVYKDLTHDTYVIEATIHYDYNANEDNISSIIELVYYTSNDTKVFQKIQVTQMGNNIEKPTITYDYEDFTVVQDEKGNITITENPDNDFVINSITDDNIINIAESSQDINVSGNTKSNNAISFTINKNVYSTTSDENGIWFVSVSGSDLVTTDNFVVVSSGVDEFGETYTEEATARYKVKTTTEAKVLIENITEDNILDNNESQEDINVYGYVTGDLTEGADVLLEVANDTFTTTVESDGKWVIPVNGQILYNTNTTKVTVSGIDIANNPVVETATKDYQTN
jgi:hypothetical protein